MSTTDSLSKIAENMWAVEGHTSLMPGVKFPIRATIVRLTDGGLMIHSPVAFSDETAAAIGQLGEPSILLAPNLFHHLYIQRAQAQFPNALTVAGPGMTEKVKTLQIDATYGPTLPGKLSEDFEHVMIEGAPRFNELVLLHRASKTLLVADYFFNIHDTKGLLTSLVLRMTGTHGKAAQSKLWRRMTKDKAAMAKSAKAVLALDYQRVVMCHGDVVEDGRDFTATSLEWLVGS